MSATATPEVLDLEIPSGRIRAERTGTGSELVLCLHGLSGNLRAFDRIVPEIAGSERQVVAVDLRGRGRSDVTPPGTYGLGAHVEDVQAIADQLGCVTFDLIGWSMGALIGIRLARATPARVRRLVMLDHAGHMDQAALDAVIAGLARLDAVVPDPEAYLSAIRAAGVADPWTPFWDDYFSYELAERPDGTWSPTTDRAACTEDVETTVDDDFRSRWDALTMPTLLVRAKGLLGGGLIVPDAELEALRATVPRLEIVEVFSNHYTMMDDPDTLAAVARFLG